MDKIHTQLNFKECYMDFGRELWFDPSGENNTTRDKPPIMEPKLDTNKNGHLEFVARRNHPRVIQAHHGFSYYGANNDFQFLIVNTTGEENSQEFGPDRYKKIANNLVAAGVGGLEQHNGVDIVQCYLAGYRCKGNQNSAKWEATMRPITEEYCILTGNEGETIGLCLQST
jgi:hypothetical protein